MSLIWQGQDFGFRILPYRVRILEDMCEIDSFEADNVFHLESFSLTANFGPCWIASQSYLN